MSSFPRTITVLGAGALGAAYASLFYEMDQNCISFTASGERHTQLVENGVVVNGKRYDIPVFSPEDSTPPSDFILIALKHRHLAQALPDLKHRVGDQTVLLSVMNGLDSEEIIGAMYGREKVLYAIAVGIDAVRESNSINYTNAGSIIFGEADNTLISERVRQVQALFGRAGIKYNTPPDMLRSLWWKFMINVGMNSPSAVLAAPYGTFQTSKHAQAIMEAAMTEVLNVAQAAGINLTDQDIEDWYTVLHTLRPEGKTSMFQDVEAGRPTEVDIFAGKMIELGRQYSIPTPVNQMLLHAIRVIEERAATSAQELAS